MKVDEEQRLYKYGYLATSQPVETDATALVKFRLYVFLLVANGS